MRKTTYLMACFFLGGLIGGFVVFTRLSSTHAARMAAQQSAWEMEKEHLEAALSDAQNRTRVVPVPAVPVSVPEPLTRLSPREIVARLRGFKSSASPGATRDARQAIYLFEELIKAGPLALPAVREFLAGNEEVDFPFAAGVFSKNFASGVPLDFVVPPSLRFGLFDVVRQIGGEEGEKVLAETLSTTGRGVELAWLARVLQQMMPDKYRDTALSAARELLARAVPIQSTSLLDRNDREHLFSVLALYKDTTYIAMAQTQVLRQDGQVDRGALKYLQQSLGPQAVLIAAQLYDDPRLADPSKKEPLARLALNFVGVDALANELYQKAINDLNMPKDARRNLIEDLNQDGFMDRKNPNAGDLQLIQNRITLIEQLAPVAPDPINAAAFREAYKDLLNMREKYLRPPPAGGQ